MQDHARERKAHDASTSQAMAAVLAIYLRRKIKDRQAVSIIEAVRAMRKAVPRCKLNDRQLAQMIVRSAAKNRQAVSFDLDE